MLQFMAFRLLRAVFTMFLVLIIAFLTLRFSGTPFDAMFPDGLTVEAEQALLDRWELNLPLHQQFLSYLGSMAHGDFGTSLFTGERVWDMYAERIAPTLAVGGMALLLAIFIGIPLGALSAFSRGSPVERVAMWIAFLGYAVPHFVIGIGLILVFGYYLRLMPTTGLSSLQHYVLPVITLAIPTIAAIARFMRAAMIDAISQPHVTAALAKGLSRRQVATQHVLRNATVPLLTLLGLEIAGVVNGSIFVEAVFSLPGVGRILVGAVQDRDFPVLQFGVLAYAAIVVVISLVIDLLYTLADPRVRVEG